MKIYKYLGISFMALTLAGCQNDEIVSGQQDGLFTLRANMNGYSNDSRAQIGLGNQNEDVEYFYWNADDQFSLIEYTSQGKIDHVFTISDSYSNDAKYHEAEFTSPTALTGQSNFVAFYPLVDEKENGDFYFGIENKLKDNTEASWLGYFKDNLFMKSTGVTSQNGLEFNQMCNLLRITYTNNTKTDRTINKIAVDGSWTYGLLMDANMYPYTEYLDDHEYGIEFTDGATIEAGKSEDFYILYFPTDVYIKGENPDLIRQPMSKISVFWGGHNSMETVAYPFGASGPDFNSNTGKRYWFKVTETADGLKWTNHMNLGEEDDTVYPEVPTGSILIKDKGFSEALHLKLEQGKVTMKDGYAIINKEYANNYSNSLNFWDLELSNPIKSLEGIEHFKNLSGLSVPESEITSCDLSQNTRLNDVNIAYPQSDRKLTSITLGNNSQLSHLDVTGNNLTSLDLSGLPNLRRLYCSENSKLSTITFSAQCYNLQELSVNNTALTSLTVPYPKSLKQLEISNTEIVPDWTQLGDLDRLDCDKRNSEFIESIPDRIKENLKELNCRNCNLTSLNMFPFKSLKTLRCSENQLTNLDLNHLTELRWLDCEKNQLAYLNLSATNVLEDLTCGFQQDAGGNYIVMKLLLSSDMQERWNNAWTNENGLEREAWNNGWSHKEVDKDGNETIYVELDTTGNAGGNSVGGSNFTYGENNIW